MKNVLRIFAAAAAFSLAATALPAHAAPAPQDQEHRDSSRNADRNDHPEYSNNSYYRTGNREGYQDYQKKQQRKDHNHKYRNNDDRAAHDYGYQQGWSGQRYNTNDRRSNDSYKPH